MTKFFFDFFKNNSNSGEKGYLIEDLYIVNGFGNPEYWQQNNRIKEIRLKVGSASNVKEYKFILEDQYDNHIQFPAVRDTSPIIQILSVYPGTKYDDTCIAEISFSPIKHADLIGSKFKPGAQLRDRDFWGRQVENSLLGKGGNIIDQGPYGYMDLEYGFWERKNGWVNIEEQYRGSAPREERDEVHLFKFSVPEQLIIDDADGDVEVDEKYFQEKKWREPK